MLLYVHVPFCRSKCAYCAFFSFVPGQADLREFPELIAREAALWGERLARPFIETVSFGGGTPSLLPARSVTRVVEAAGSSFSLSPTLEFTFEANPDSARDLAFLRLLIHSGVNRLSLGVQSLDDRELNLLGRRHTADQAHESYALARTAGFGNISLDLMFGLPGQTPAGWLNTLSMATALEPEHLSCYGLSVEPGTPLEARILEGALALPTDEEQAAMFLEGAALLQRQGYEHYEISNFALPGMRCRHNAGYWRGDDYLGLGPGAVSTVSGRRWKNPENIGEYARQLRDGSIGQEAELLDQETVAKERVMLAMRTSEGMSRQQYFSLVPEGVRPSMDALLAAMEQEGLVAKSPERIALTEGGMLLSNEILAALLWD
jgi:putative oxygen-independent coproporphyrinogen III oxidase